MQPIYLDYNASTPVDMRVLNRMLPYFNERFGNASSRQRSFFEGTAVMAVSSFFVIGVTLALPPESMLSRHSIPFSANSLIIVTLTGGITATAIEAISPKGTDNLFVPFLSAGAMYFIAALVSG